LEWENDLAEEEEEEDEGGGGEQQQPQPPHSDILSDVPVLVKRDQAGTFVVPIRACGGVVDTIGAGGWGLLPCTEQFHTVCRRFGETDLLTFCEFVNGLRTAST
jgi:hypothetical protein